MRPENAAERPQRITAGNHSKESPHKIAVISCNIIWGGFDKFRLFFLFDSRFEPLRQLLNGSPG